MTRVHRQKGAEGGRSSTVCQLFVVLEDDSKRVRSHSSTRKAHSNGAALDALAVFECPACFYGTPGPAGTLFR